MLGLYIDNQLTFKEHSKRIKNKTRSVVSAIKRISKFISIESATKILRSCLINKIVYGGLFYLTKKSIRDDMQKIVMRAVRIIKKKKLKDKIRNDILLESLGVPSLEVITKRQCLLEMAKLGEKRELIFPSMNERTRGNAMKKVRPISRNQRLQNSFLYQMQKLWNDFNHLLEEPITKKGKEMIKAIIK